MKKTYRTRNWSHYTKSLKQRGNFTLWIDENSLAHWYHANDLPKRGRPFQYADKAIECALIVKSIYHLSLRATQGLMESLISLLKVEMEFPDYTTVCRRQRRLAVSLKHLPKSGAVHVVIDSSGLKIFGEGEWKVRQHGYSKRRSWRKIHIGVDEALGDILAVEVSDKEVAEGEVLPDLLTQIDSTLSQVTADPAYDTRRCYQAIEQRGARAVIPPKRYAKIRPTGKHPILFSRARNEAIRYMRSHGRKKWKRHTRYHRRSLAETAIYRFKQLRSDKLSARYFENQCTEVFIKCNLLNKMIELTMSES